MNPRLANPAVVATLLFQLGFASVDSARGQQTCQPNDFSLSMTESEWDPAADDFRPLGTTISSVTVWGAYVSWNEQGEMIDCSDGAASDFFVRVNSESATLPLPGSFVGSSDATVVSMIEVPPQGAWVGSPLKLWNYELQLDTPITGLDDSGATAYWIMVASRKSFPWPDTCRWHWLGTDTVFNQHAVAGPLYGAPMAARTRDFAFCLDIEFETPPTPLAPCCDCSGGCEMATQLACESSGRHWRLGVAACTPGLCPAGPPPNDSCATAMSLPSVGPNQQVANYCATTDGPSPVPTENGSVAVENDLWYTFIPESNDLVSVWIELCESGLAGDGVLDSVLSVYYDPNNPTECVCPDELDPDAFLWPAGLASDDECDEVRRRGSGFAAGEVCGGACLMIRVSGAAGWPSSAGEARLVYTYSVVDMLWPPSLGDTTCAGGTSAGARCGVDSDCVGGLCHAKCRYLSINPGGDPPCPDSPIFSLGAIRVNVVDSPDASMVGDTWWAGVDQLFTDVGGGTFSAAPLECTSSSVVRFWPVDKPLHLYGPAVVPGAKYEVSVCWSLPGPCSTPLLIQTGTWGDIVPPLGTPNFADISACVGTFTGAGNAPSRTRSKLQPALIDPSVAVSFADISSAVGAFMGQGYPFAYAQCP